MKKVVVAVSGGFDPVHVGHLRLFQEAKSLGDHLVVILNNDHWLRKKKGFVFMPQEERREILLGFSCVNQVLFTSHSSDCSDMSVCSELTQLRPSIFANGGDRKADNIPEYVLCEQLGIQMVFNIGGGKVQSSSEMVQRAAKTKS